MLAKDGSFGKQTPNIGSDPLAHTSNRGWILWNTMLAKDGSFGTHLREDGSFSTLITEVGSFGTRC